MALNFTHVMTIPRHTSYFVPTPPEKTTLQCIQEIAKKLDVAVTVSATSLIYDDTPHSGSQITFYDSTMFSVSARREITDLCRMFGLTFFLMLRDDGMEKYESR